MIIARLLQAAFVMVAVAFLGFLLFRYLGDPVNNLVGQGATAADRAALRAALGLDQPVALQFLHFLGHAAVGDFGTSLRVSQPVRQVIGERLPATLELSFTAIVLSLLIGIPLGIRAATHRASWGTSILMTVSLIGISLPTFMVGLLLILVFAVWLGWLPAFGRGDVVRVGFWTTGFLTASGLRALVLPSVTLALFQMTLIMRLVRAQMIEVLRSDYIRFARARGLPPWRIVLHHALRNALGPVVTVLALQLGSAVAFSIIVETVFQWPGVGQMVVLAIAFADVPLLVAYLVLVALLFVVVNMLADIAAWLMDPRIRERRT